MLTKTVYDFTFIFDETHTFSEVFSILIAEKIMQQIDRKGLPNRAEIGYNTDRIPVPHVSGLCNAVT